MSSKQTTSIIIGAGQTGRGFIAPLLKKDEHQIIFIDKDKELIQTLSNKEQYKVRYFGDKLLPCTVKDYYAFLPTEDFAITAIAKADYIFTAVGEEQIKNIIPLIRKSLEVRKSMKIDSPLILVTCENGVNPKKALIEADLNKKMIITEGIVFCTTLSKNKNNLDLYSEDFDYIPYDVEASGKHFNLSGFKPISKFKNLIERKIFTYNCYSACISYIGDYIGYSNYAEAANDKDINKLLHLLSKPVNQSIATHYKVPIKEQELFSEQAISKFKNKEIKDTIARNTRDVHRKLLPNERLIKPLSLMKQYKQSTNIIELIIAASLHFGSMNNQWTESIDGILKNTCKIDSVKEREKIIQKYHWFQKNLPVEVMINEENK
ncbi:mannitol dehydrogenase family protein [Oceanobacillus jeddahense]|uniref:mannitol dehydrogenase family protein n=1 Tax=Oceanobacillus jeddahense TaxID=1462527 RepID=UPI00362A2572